MKKELITGLLAILVLSMLFCSCGVTKEDKPNKERIETEESDDIDANIALFRLDSYADYLKFLKEDNRSKTLISYDSLKQIGEFRSFIVLSVNPEDFSKLYYSFTDSSGFTVNLTITDLSKRESSIEQAKSYSPELEGFDSLTNLRSLGKDISGHITIEDVKYYYVKGNLLSVEWQYNNYELSLSGDGYLCEYPKDVSDTFTSTLFNRETFKKSIDSLMEAIWG
ncbi:MAG: hypothetical protein K6B54_08130 [Clostridia bacterium]|nr:hypothetical protein [Clostridia bacterium]